MSFFSRTFTNSDPNASANTEQDADICAVEAVNAAQTLSIAANALAISTETDRATEQEMALHDTITGEVVRAVTAENGILTTLSQTQTDLTAQITDLQSKLVTRGEWQPYEQYYTSNLATRTIGSKIDL